MSKPRPDFEDKQSVSCDCKIGRVCQQYDLEHLIHELGERWASEDKSTSLRQLATDFNKSVLQAAMENVDQIPLDGEIDNLYRLLTNEDADTRGRIRARNQLSKHGIDVTDLQSSFTSYQTVNRHLKQCLDVQKSTKSEDDTLQPDAAIKRIRALQNRTKVVTEKTVDQLQNNGTISSEDTNVLVDISIFCNDCQSQIEIGQLDSGKVCDCD